MKQNFIDKLIGIVSPSSAVRRAQSRKALDIMERRYDGATNTRRGANWSTSNQGPNSINEISLDKLRGRARDLARNNAWAKNAITTIASNVIGTGMLPNIKNKKLRRIWQDWAETKMCDFYGKQNMYGLQRQAMEAITRDGEVIIRRRRSMAAGIPLKLQIQEADCIDSMRTYSDNGDRVIQGVQYNSKGDLVGYWLYDEHPNDTLNYTTSKFIPASDVIHIFRADRPGQARGVTWLAAVMLRLKDYDDYEDAELIRQKVAACFAAFVQDQTSDGETAGEEMLLERLEPGVIETLPAGKTITFANPPLTQNYDNYSRKVLMGIAKGIGISYEAMTGDLSRVNFSSARMGWMEMQRNIEDWQYNLMVPQFCDSVWTWFIESSILAGKVPSTTPSVIQWTPPRREMIDPVREIPALINAVRGGVYSLQEVHRQIGYDTEQVLSQIEEDNKMMDAKGLVLDSDPRKMMKAGVAQAYLKSPSAAAGFEDEEDEPVAPV
jgi:lambda family phage portal protein